MRWLSILFVFWLAVETGVAQDLDQLRSRAEDHWKRRASGDRAAAAQLVQRDGRAKFIELYEPQIKSAKVDSFQFLENSKDVLVTVKAKMDLTIGIFDKTITERWVWDGNWFLHIGPLAAMPFDKPAVSANTPTSPTFELLDSEVNLGRHVQGDQIPVSVRFKASRPHVANVLVRGIPSLTNKGIQWLNSDEGKIDFVVDTSLMSADISQVLTLELVTLSGEQVAKTVKIAGAIEGRIRFKQTPEIIDPAVASKVEVEISNLTSATVKLAGIASFHPAFLLEEVQTPIEIKPGESRKFQISHEAQRVPESAQLLLEFSDKLFPQPIYFPLNVKLPQDRNPLDPANLDPGMLRQLLNQPGVQR